MFLGKVILSPPIGVRVGREGYTEDWAVIEVDASKIDIDNFNSNAIDLGTQISDQEFAHKMNWNPQNTDSEMVPLVIKSQFGGNVNEWTFCGFQFGGRQAVPCGDRSSAVGPPA
ncbi:hypothetical protein BGY98DRAFT_935883 [Russula aff. rugulosa BPL654]|nr:hypothetical protein BGY98DRAFT_935883 [Russula aff. rugulosa BPL654]